MTLYQCTTAEEMRQEIELDKLKKALYGFDNWIAMLPVAFFMKNKRAIMLIKSQLEEEINKLTQ